MRTNHFSRIALWSSTLRHRLSSLVRPPLARVSAHLRVLVVSFLLAATLLAGFNTPFAYGLGASRAIAQTPAPQGKPHKIDPKSGTKSVLHQPPASKAPQAGPSLKARPAMSHGFVPTMKPGTLKLDPNNATQFVGSDGRLEIDVPAGAITASDVASIAGHTLGLRITEIAPPSGSNAGSGPSRSAATPCRWWMARATPPISLPTASANA